MAEQALLDRLKRYSKHCLTQHTDPDFAKAVYEAADLIDNLCDDLAEAQEEIEKLSADVVPVKHGKWYTKSMTRRGGHGEAYFVYGCSLCKKKIRYKTDFCPNCGARMDGE